MVRLPMESLEEHKECGGCKKVCSVGRNPWQKALEVYEPEAHPDVYATIIVDCTDLNLAARSRHRSK